MKKLITIHRGYNSEKYGYESSQVSRSIVAKKLGFKFVYLLTVPQLRPNWKKRYHNFGFEQSMVYSLPNFFVDCGNDEMSVEFCSLENELKDGEVFYDNGVISHVKTEDGVWYFSSAPYLFEKNNGVLEWYNRDGSLGLKAKFFDPNLEPTPLSMEVADYLYFKDDKWLTSEDLLIQFLDRVSTRDDIIIRDMHEIPMLKLWRYVEFAGLNYYEFIHHNVFMSSAPNLRYKTKYLVASENLTEELVGLGYNVRFVPPIFVDKSVTKLNRANHKKYCFVGNMQKIKRVDLVIEAFSELKDKDITLDMYGKCDELLNFNLPDNIKLCGYVDNVPYEDYDGYISASFSELFGNSCVEALASGLTCLLSNVDFAHKYYYKFVNSGSVQLFDTCDDLVELIKTYETKDVDLNNQLLFVDKYSLENVSNHYLKL